MRHLTHQEAIEWRDGKRDHERERIVAHLASCGACAAQLAFAVREAEAPVAPSPASDAQIFVEVGRRTGPRPKRIAPVWVGLAATLVVAIGGAVLLVRRPSQVDIVRGATAFGVVLEAPDGVVAAGDVIRFSWTGTSGPVRLLVVDLDGTSEPLVDEAVSGTAFVVSAGRRAKFVPGRTYRWLIEYTDESGTVRSTPAAGFSIRNERQ